jgi:16S rRNA (cytosine1402-N4)-methyltransferase
MSEFAHITVLKSETIEVVLKSLQSHKNTDDLLFADCTLGGAGHTLELLSELCRNAATGTSSHAIELLCFDQDPAALAVASERIESWRASHGSSTTSVTTTLVHSNFKDLRTWLTSHRPNKKLNGLMADLGVSSPQLDHAERGFSFLKSGPLDMRMNNNCGTTAQQLLETLTEQQLTQIFSNYGEEPRARALAKAIVKDRSAGTLPLSNTVTFAQYVARVLGYHQSRVHPATRVFQALRIAVNDELGSVEHLLRDVPDLMADGGVAAFISFHSLEDRLVKQYFRAWESGCLSPTQKRKNDQQMWLETQAGILSTGSESGAPTTWGVETPRGGILAGDDELKLNPRSRSARLRGFCFKKM